MQNTTDKHLANRWKGNTRFTADNRAYQFDMLSDTWVLSLKHTLDLGFLSGLSLDPELELNIRRFLAIHAMHTSATTVLTRYKELKKTFSAMTNAQYFQSAFQGLSLSSKYIIKYSFAILKKAGSKDAHELMEYFSDIMVFLENVDIEQPDRSTTIKDPQKGSYSEVEYTALQDAMRHETLDIVKAISESKPCPKPLLQRLKNAVACHLLIALVRRPVQLRELKWCDVHPIGVAFGNHRETGLENTELACPPTQQTFSDVEQLHIRTFRGKTGRFRRFVERKTHRIEPNLSRFLLFYRHHYQQQLAHSCEQKGITLSPGELNELLLRSPLFPEARYFSDWFESKSDLFSTLGRNSEVMHQTNTGLGLSIRSVFANKKLASDRIPNLQLANNRLRHTVLSNGALDGLSLEQLAAITGVTMRAVKAYLDLSMGQRTMIDDAFAEQKLFKQFAATGVGLIQKQPQFTVKNELDETVGYIDDVATCATCEARLGRPLGCYGCDSFRPFVEGDHGANLIKLERKLALNQGTPNSVKPIEKAIIYCKATIKVCETIALQRRGVK